MVQVAINRRHPGHAEVLDFLDAISQRYGSATNAAVQIIRESEGFVVSGIGDRKTRGVRRG